MELFDTRKLDKWEKRKIACKAVCCSLRIAKESGYSNYRAGDAHSFAIDLVQENTMVRPNIDLYLWKQYL